MNDVPAISAERVVQPFRDACERLISPAAASIARTEVLGAEIRRVAALCATDLQVMSDGVRPGSAVVRQAQATARSHREEEREMDHRFVLLEDDVGSLVERTRNHAAQQQAVARLAGDRCDSAQQAVALVGVQTSAVEALHEVTVAARDGVAAATDRLRALLRHQG